MDDVRAVMDTVKSERAVLFGVSEGGPMCMLFAATYPERCTGVVMAGSYARKAWAARPPLGPIQRAVLGLDRGDTARLGRSGGN